MNEIDVMIEMENMVRSGMFTRIKNIEKNTIEYGETDLGKSIREKIEQGMVLDDSEKQALINAGLNEENMRIGMLEADKHRKRLQLGP